MHGSLQRQYIKDCARGGQNILQHFGWLWLSLSVVGLREREGESTVTSATKEVHI